MASQNSINMFATRGKKGSDCYASTSDMKADLYVRLNRGLKEVDLIGQIDAIIGGASPQDLVDLWVLAFQTRDIRGGKGERDLGRMMWLRLASHMPAAASATVGLLPEYGRWEDINQLIHGMGSDQWLLRHALMVQIAAQLRKDDAILASGSGAKLTLVGRHVPREHDNRPKDKALAKELALLMYPGDEKRNKKYRQLVARLGRALEVPEVAMSAGQWSSLKPAKMPGRCLTTKLKGLLNQPVRGTFGRKVILTDPDRVACAATFSEHLGRASKGEAKVKGADVVFPHELVAKVLKHCEVPALTQTWVPESGEWISKPNPERLSAEELDAMEAQWRSIVDPIKAAGVLGEWLAMCDFSGSMAGDPMHVSLALGLIVAECNTGLFKDCILTFDSTPILHTFRISGLVNRIKELRALGIGQGLSTDFQAAYNRVLAALVQSGVSASMAPKYLLVLTDMCFDAASGHGQANAYKYAVKTADHETHVQIARRAFVKQGDALFGDGKGWAAPTIVVWNLRSEGGNFQATSKEEGVLQVSGWSPSLLKLLATRGLGAFSSEAILRIALDDPRYDAVRDAVSGVLMPSSGIDYEGLD